jgi:hypothetical protein
MLGALDALPVKEPDGVTFATATGFRLDATVEMGVLVQTVV